MIRKLVGLMFVCFATIGFFVACNGSFEDGCSFDEDCFDDEICYNDPDASQYCVALCDSTDECGLDEVCRERDDSAADDTTICLGPPASCEEHTDCPDGWICDDEDNVCVDPDDDEGPDSYYTFLIEDWTHEEGGTDRCGDVTYGYKTAGANIYSITLYDGGDVVAHADYADFARGFFAEDEYDGDADDLDGWMGAPAFIFDGSAPDFIQDCPTHEGGDTDNSTFHEDAVATLGCGGLLFVQFFDDGDIIELTEDHTVEVREYDDWCSDEYADSRYDVSSCDDSPAYCPQSEADPYRAWICTDRSDGGIDEDSCDQQLNGGNSVMGIFDFEIELP